MGNVTPSSVRGTRSSIQTTSAAYTAITLRQPGFVPAFLFSV